MIANSGISETNIKRVALPRDEWTAGSYWGKKKRVCGRTTPNPPPLLSASSIQKAPSGMDSAFCIKMNGRACPFQSAQHLPEKIYFFFQNSAT